MSLRAILSRRTENRFAALFVTSALCLNSIAALAATDATGASQQDALRALGQQFAQRIGQKLDEADTMMSGGNKLKLKELQSGSTIPEGEPLIMRGFLGKSRLQLAEDIGATRHGDKLMVSLADLCVALELPITVSPAAGAATGWFMNESNIFALDTKKLELTANGKVTPVDASDIFATADDIMLSTNLLESTFGMDIDFDLSALNIFIKSAVPLAIENKDKRAHESKYKSAGYTDAKLPLVEEPYHVFSKPYLDVSTGVAYVHPSANTPDRETANWSVIGSGDVLGFSSRTFAGGGWNSDGTGNAINTLRQTFGREDADGKVLKSYQFGDVDTVMLPLVGGTAQEQGVYLSNQLPGQVTTQSRIDVKGDGQPGWDVELYNNDSLLGLATVGDDGRYNFPAVFLFEGDNALRLVFYGPQGQTREETRHVVSNASTLKAGESKWETSLSRTNITTYNANQADQPNDGDAHLVARYEYSLGPEASINAGVTHRSDTNGIISEQKDYLQVGGAANFMGALFTADTAYDIDGEYMTDVLARRSFGAHQVGLELAHSSGQFEQGSLGSFAAENTIQADMRGPFANSFMGLTNLNYTADAGYNTYADGGKNLLAGGAISANYKTFGASTGLHYSKTDGPLATDSGKITGATTFGGFAGLGRWRFASDYDVDPTFDLTSLALNYTYPFSPKLEGIADLTHTNALDVTELALSARWRPDKIAVTPRIAVDTNHQVTAGINVNFGLADNPYDSGYTMFNRTLTATGGVAARVFLDKNGNGIYDGDDELLPDVDVQSLQVSGRAKTDSKGVAFIPTLQRSLRTDIVVTPETLPDPYDMVSTDGVSIRARPGVTSKFDFPVVVAGEMDGQVGYEGDNGLTSIRGVAVKLVAPDGSIVQSSPVGSDGYYSLSGIRPGVYSLVADVGPNGKPGSAPPKTMIFKPEGSTYFGENIALTEGDDTRFAFRSVNSSPVRTLPGHIVTQDDIGARGLVIRVGEYRSRVALALGWYRLKFISGWDQLFTPSRPIDDITPDRVTATMGIPLKPVRPVSMAQAINTCREIESHSYKCTVEIVTRYNEVKPPLAVPLAPKPVAEKKDAAPAPAAPKKTAEAASVAPTAN